MAFTRKSAEFHPRKELTGVMSIGRDAPAHLISARVVPAREQGDMGHVQVSLGQDGSTSRFDLRFGYYPVSVDILRGEEGDVLFVMLFDGCCRGDSRSYGACSEGRLVPREIVSGGCERPDRTPEEWLPALDSGRVFDQLEALQALQLTAQRPGAQVLSRVEELRKHPDAYVSGAANRVVLLRRNS